MTEFLCIMNSTFASKILFEVNEMLKLREDQLTLWDAILPEPFRSLPEELAKIDALLDDPAFISIHRKTSFSAWAAQPFRQKRICV